ncbi:MAG TPA: class II fructose-bisphosphate aldolase [Thermoanaerobacter sp.]|nr:class II fructose-bisphosphate aldolase [Thermoanaerobacter sp.]
MLVNLREILAETRKNKYAVPAFDVSDLTTFKAVAETAEELRSPIIVMILDTDVKDGYLRYIVPMIKEVAAHSRIPICLHLDHGPDIETVIKYISLGFNSVMIDASTLPLEKNIEITRQVVKLAHSAGITVEAELGHVGVGLSDNEETIRSFLTIPKEVDKFVKETQVDALAVAIGTAHGPYKGALHLDIPRLREIAKITETPLVLHGGSYTPEEQVKEAIITGISKVNIATELRVAFIKGIKETIATANEYVALSEIFEKPLLFMKELVKSKIELCGSSNRA